MIGPAHRDGHPVTEISSENISLDRYGKNIKFMLVNVKFLLVNIQYALIIVEFTPESIYFYSFLIQTYNCWIQTCKFAIAYLNGAISCQLICPKLKNPKSPIR